MGGTRCRAAWGTRVLLAALVHGAAWAAAATTPAREPIPAACEQYSELYEPIRRDVGFFKGTGGITPQLFYRTMRLHSAGNKHKGLAVAFYNGRAYVISNTRRMVLKPFGHHVTLWVAYLKVMLDLEQRYGGCLPNVEFVWHTIDRPVLLTNRTGGVNYPVFRFGKSAAHPDILVPNFHFYMKRYQAEYLDRMDARLAERPWDKRAPKLFSRFSGYDRYVHPGDPHTQRLGAGGAPLCVVKGRSTSICPVRLHLHHWAANHTELLDINKDRHVSMDAHADFRYILHVDGQGLSSKLEVLLTLGSLVMKEESGYEAFYHHLLKPGVHYVPVWKAGSGPEDILEAVQWARDNDDKARDIAAAGRALAARYLSTEARACYWLKLFQAYGEAMTYDPVVYRNVTFRTVTRTATGRTAPAGQADGGGAQAEETVVLAEAPGGARREGRLPYVKPARQFLEEDVYAFDRNLVRDLVWEP